VAQALHVYHGGPSSLSVTLAHVYRDIKSFHYLQLIYNYFQFISHRILCFDDESTEKKKAAALLLLRHLRKHDEAHRPALGSMIRFVKYDKQYQQRKAAFNEPNPHTTQQQEPSNTRGPPRKTDRAQGKARIGLSLK
jgi:hypothetical protein